MRVTPIVRTGAARMLKPTTNAVTAPDRERDLERRPCTLSNTAVTSGMRGMGTMTDSNYLTSELKQAVTTHVIVRNRGVAFSLVLYAMNKAS